MEPVHCIMNSEPKFTVRLLIICPSELINVGRIRRLDNESVHQGNIPLLHALDGDPGADDIIASFSRRPNGIPTAFFNPSGVLKRPDAGFLQVALRTSRAGFVFRHSNKSTANLPPKRHPSSSLFRTAKRKRRKTNVRRARG